jgi:hypothetical protein
MIGRSYQGRELFHGAGENPADGCDLHGKKRCNLSDLASIESFDIVASMPVRVPYQPERSAYQHALNPSALNT